MYNKSKFLAHVGQYYFVNQLSAFLTANTHFLDILPEMPYHYLYLVSFVSIPSSVFLSPTILPLKELLHFFVLRSHGNTCLAGYQCFLVFCGLTCIISGVYLKANVWLGSVSFKYNTFSAFS